MATKKKEVFPEAKTEDIEKVPELTPAQYFDNVKSKINEETPENLQALYNVTLKNLKKYMVTGQKKAAKELYSKCLYLEKEQALLNKGITKYVKRSDIEKYVDKVANDCVCVIEMSNFDRPIPDDIVDIVADTMDIFNEFYVIFTDYTGETRSKVEKERREKDPILFGNIFIDGRVSPKMYFIGDWVDDYCDLTLDKMIEELAKDAKKSPDDFVYNIEDGSDLDSIETELFGTSTRTKTRGNNK